MRALKLIFGSKHNKRISFENILEQKTMKDFSEKPNELGYFCMDLIKEQLSKH